MEEEKWRGQAMVEYALLLVPIAGAVSGVQLHLGGQINSRFTSLSRALGGRSGRHRGRERSLNRLIRTAGRSRGIAGGPNLSIPLHPWWGHVLMKCQQ